MSPSPPPGVVLVKLGGSLLTDKTRPDTARLDTIRRLAGEIARARPALDAQLVLGHGSGSFGHAAAARHRLDESAGGPEQLSGVSHTQGKARELHARVTDALREAGNVPFSIAPGSAAVAEDGRIVSFATEPLVLALRAGLLPVVFGDVVLDRRRGACICSTETVFTHLVAHLPRRGIAVQRVLWLGETDGVYDSDGRVLVEITPGSATAALTHAGGSAGVDVTGGMAHRVATAVDLAVRGVPSLIANGTVPGLLERALAGEEVIGTRVHIPS